jgi:AcrR family transcriptional regulator
MSLSTNQAKVLAGLLNPDFRTIEDIASACNLHERTIYNYLADDDFKKALDDATAKAIQTASAKLAALSSKAVDTLGTMLVGDASDTNKRLAAIAILEALYKVLNEKSIQERLEKIEQRLLAMGK